MFVREFLERNVVWLARLSVLGFLALAAWWVFDLPAAIPLPDGGEGTFLDRDLYITVAERVANGENYYAAAADLHRAHGYPTTPWFAIRLPTQATLIAWLGIEGSALLLRGLLVAGALAWMVALYRAGSNVFEIVGAGIAILTGGLVAFFDVFFLHEFWAGIFVSLAFAAYRPGAPWLSVFFVLIACAFREFAILALGAGFALAIVERRKGEAFAWFAAGLLVAGFYGWHAQQVIAVRQAGDLASQGWSGMIGPLQTIREIVGNSVYLAPGFLTGGILLIASMSGWFAGRERGWIVVPVLLGWFVVMSLLSRPENYYWSQFFLPWLPVGLVFFPRLCLTAIGRTTA